MQLPQEIKVLPADEEIIFYEGLPPIRCGKIRYYTDPVFTARLMPPPDRPPAIDAKYRVVSAKAEAPKPAGRLSDPPAETANERVGTAADVERMEQLTVEDFSDHAESVEIKVGADGRVSEANLKSAAQQLHSTLRVDHATYTKQTGR